MNIEDFSDKVFLKSKTHQNILRNIKNIIKIELVSPCNDFHPN